MSIIEFPISCCVVWNLKSMNFNKLFFILNLVQNQSSVSMKVISSLRNLHFEKGFRTVYLISLKEMLTGVQGGRLLNAAVIEKFLAPSSSLFPFDISVWTYWLTAELLLLSVLATAIDDNAAIVFKLASCSRIISIIFHSLFHFSLGIFSPSLAIELNKSLSVTRVYIEEAIWDRAAIQMTITSLDTTIRSRRERNYLWENKILIIFLRKFQEGEQNEIEYTQRTKSTYTMTINTLTNKLFLMLTTKYYESKAFFQTLSSCETKK